MPSDVLMDTCRGMNAMEEVSQVLNPIPSTLYGDMVWLSIEESKEPLCDWNKYTPESNCKYIQALISAVELRGKKAGIYA